MVQNVIGWRLHQVGHLHAKHFFDLTNAFGSVNTSSLLSLFEQMEPLEKSLFGQCLLDAAVVVEIENVDCCFRPGSCDFPGGSIAAEVFGGALWRAIDPWLQAGRQANPSLVVESIIDEQDTFRFGVTSFVDDLASINMERVQIPQLPGTRLGSITPRCNKKLRLVSAGALLRSMSRSCKKEQLPAIVSKHV